MTDQLLFASSEHSSEESPELSVEVELLLEEEDCLLFFFRFFFSLELDFLLVLLMGGLLVTVAVLLTRLEIASLAS